MTRFAPEQVQALLAPIKPHRVLRDGKGMSHVAAFDVIAHLNRLFGFGGWRKEVLSLELVREHEGQNKKGHTAWWVTYRCVLRLTVFAPDGSVAFVTDDAATGSATGLPSHADAHDFAVKNAVSYAVKRCAKDLGDQFGLSLYNKGQVTPLVGKTLVGVEPVEGDVQDAAPETLVMGNDERPEVTPDDEPAAESAVSTPVLKAQADELTGLFTKITNSNQRAALKRAFAAEFGKPTELDANRFGDALAWLGSAIAEVEAS